MNFAPILKLAAPLAGMVTTIVVDALLDKAADKVFEPETREKMSNKFVVGLAGAVVGGIVSTVVVKTVEHIVDKKILKEQDELTGFSDETIENITNYAIADAEATTRLMRKTFKKDPTLHDYTFTDVDGKDKTFVAANYDDACDLFLEVHGVSAVELACKVRPHQKNAFGL